MAQSVSGLAQLVDLRVRRRNARILIAYFVFAASAVVIDSVLFQALMWWLEGKSYSFLNGVYWTLSTMSTLGLGDIVFTTTIGRMYTMFVLLTGIVLFLVVLPFAFIRFFYTPWLASRAVPANISKHVIITGHGDLARPLSEAFDLHRVPHFVIESDPTRAALLEKEGVPVIGRPADEPSIYNDLRIDHASLVVLDGSDAENTASVLQIRDISLNAHIAAVSTSESSEEILRIAGATNILPLKRQLGEHLATRLNAGHAQTHTIGRFRDLRVAELPVQMTPWAGKTIRELQLRDRFGINVVGILEHARFKPVHSESILGSHSVPVIIGTAKQIRALDEFLVIYNVNYNPVIIIGGGVVGRAATRVLQQRGVPVHVIDLRERPGDWGDVRPDRWLVGDATNQQVILDAGLAAAPSVLLTTNDDAMNIYLALQYNHLAPETRILSRVTHERNLTAVQRAGAQIAISHTSLGVSSVFAALHRRELVVLGEGVELHRIPAPASMIGSTLSEAAIASHSGLNVIAIERGEGLIGNPPPETTFEPDDGLVMVGAPAQLQLFQEHYS